MYLESFRHCDSERLRRESLTPNCKLQDIERELALLRETGITTP